MKTALNIIAGVLAVFTFAFFAFASAVEFLIRGKEILTDIE